MNPWVVLGVDESASPEEVKAAYRKLAMQHHPDRNGGSPESLKKFQEIQEAYEATKSKHPSYDQGNPMDEDFFRNFGGFSFNFARRNSDYQARAQISFEDAITGTELSMTINNKVITVRIPKGVDSGYRIRVDGEGSHQFSELPPGNLYVTVHVSNNSAYQRNGADLHTRYEVDAIDLMLGCEIMIKSIMGDDLKVVIPEASGITKMRLQGQGMPHFNSDERGDLYLHLMPNFPKILNAKQRKALNSFKKA